MVNRIFQPDKKAALFSAVRLSTKSEVKASDFVI